MPPPQLAPTLRISKTRPAAPAPSQAGAQLSPDEADQLIRAWIANDPHQGRPRD